MNESILDRLVSSLTAAAEFNAGAHSPPVALLWPDEAGHWQPVIDRIAQRLPVVCLGNFDADKRRGPAYWVRCVIAGTIDAGLPDGIPIVYLPGVGRGSIRAVDACPAFLAPIAELQYRSQWFSHPNSRDWTVRALLSHPGRGAGLHVADDADTSAALVLALDRLLDEPISRLAKQVIDADLLNNMMSPDPISSLLRWLDDAGGFRFGLGGAQWSAFEQQCKNDYGFVPTSDGDVTAARRLGQAKGNWAQVWKRYTETPDLYPGIPGQLRKGRPEELIVDNPSAWPQDNEVAEDQLRSSLLDFNVLTAEGARKEAVRLDKENLWRRSTVWADLDLAPLAFSLEQLVVLAELTAQPLDSSDLKSMVADYGARGWQADDAVLRALVAARSPADRLAAGAAAAALYRTWLNDGAKALQGAVGPMANAQTYRAGPPASVSAGTVTVFVDGLRLDVAHRVAGRLADVGLQVDMTTSLAALPTVTETAKAALVPTSSGALRAGPDLYSANAATGTKASIHVLRALMAEQAVQVLVGVDTGDPSGTAWTEAGELDHRGHDVGVRLVDYIDGEVQQVVTRIRELLDAGWQQVDVVTDHGWLLVPGGMEKVELPAATCETKKGRCARLKPGALVDAPTVPWFWDQDVRIAVAPGASCFEAGKEYEHGGISPQECIVPRVSVRVGSVQTTALAPEIIGIKWLGLLCRIELTGDSQGVRADLRALPADPKTSIAEEAKETLGAGKVSLVVPDEDLTGERAFLVLVASDGRILAQRDVVVGRNR